MHSRTFDYMHILCIHILYDSFGCVMDVVLDIGSKDRGFKSGRERRSFKGDNNPQHAFLRKGIKAVGPMS
jgi:hypothetical protein